jgi:predicted nucleotidyltransferase
MKALHKIKQTLAAHKEELRERYKVIEIGLFGSYVKGEQKESSDVDVLVEFEAPVSLLHIVSLENHLCDILGMKVDVVPKKNIREELRDNIMKEAISV